MRGLKRKTVIRHRLVMMVTIMACTVLIAVPIMAMVLEREYINWPIYAGMVFSIVWLIAFYYSNVIWKGAENEKM